MAPKMVPLFRAKIIFRTIKNEPMTFEHVNVAYLKQNVPYLKHFDFRMYTTFEAQGFDSHWFQTMKNSDSNFKSMLVWDYLFDALQY